MIAGRDPSRAYRRAQLGLSQVKCGSGLAIGEIVSSYG